MRKSKLQNLTSTISNKLKLLEDVLGLKPTDMADIGGCSQASYYRYRSGNSVPGWDFLRNIIKYDNKINADWLLKDTGPILNTEDISSQSTQRVVMLPFFKMYESKSGEGSLKLTDWEASKEEISICVDIFNLMTLESFEHLIAVKVQCDAMYPDIKPGSLVIVDKLQNNVNLDGIYLMKMDDSIRLKQVQKAPNNKVQLSTINSKYKPILISLDELDDSIIGKIAWVGTPYN